MANIYEQVYKSGSGQINLELVNQIKRKISDLQESPNRDIFKTVVSMDGVLKSKYIGNSKAKIDAYAGKTGILVLIGTNDIIYKRLLSAYHHYKMGKINSIIIICDSYHEAWWKENENKEIKKKGDGNRAHSQNVSAILSSINDWYDMDSHILIFERKISRIRHEEYLMD
tara:strand:+ start:152 stop:661 length:510 start_codon:yes stop_codon:yes gene_type:complete